MEKNFDNSSYNKYSKKELERINKEELLGSKSPIKEFKKVPGISQVSCLLEDGTEHEIPTDSTLQLFFDKMEMNPETKVDFGGLIRDKVVVLPFQNKILYIDGVTGKQKKTLSIDSSLIYSETDSITGKVKEFNSKLNPAILSILADDKVAQNDYINATGNIDIIYDFEEKADKIRQNMANKKIAKKMNEYYKSEKEYVQELQLEKELSKKIGYLNMLDKMQTSIVKAKETQEERKARNEIKYLDEECVNYIKRKKESEDIMKGLYDSTNRTTNMQSSLSEPKDNDGREYLGYTQKSRKELLENLRNIQDTSKEQTQKPVNANKTKSQTTTYNRVTTNGWDR